MKSIENFTVLNPWALLVDFLNYLKFVKVPLFLWRRKGSQPPIQPSPFYLARLRSCMLLRTLTGCSESYLFCTRDPLLPLQYVETTMSGQLNTTSILSSVANYKNEDDVIVLDDDIHYCLLMESLDSGDTRTRSARNKKNRPCLLYSY